MAFSRCGGGSQAMASVLRCKRGPRLIPRRGKELAGDIQVMMGPSVDRRCGQIHQSSAGQGHTDIRGRSEGSLTIRGYDCNSCVQDRRENNVVSSVVSQPTRSWFAVATAGDRRRVPRNPRETQGYSADCAGRLSVEEVGGKEMPTGRTARLRWWLSVTPLKFPGGGLQAHIRQRPCPISVPGD